MRLTVHAARTLAEQVMTAVGHDAASAALIADHLIDCELRGHLLRRAGARAQHRRALDTTDTAARWSSSAKRRCSRGSTAAIRSVTSSPTVRRESPSRRPGPAASRRRGAQHLVHRHAVVLRRDGGGRGLVSMIASNASPWVAPHGATEGRFGTNPICFGFPSAGRARDLGHRHLGDHPRRGEAAPPARHAAAGGRGLRRRGPPDARSRAALAGAFAPWGGHKGSGLGIVVQLLGMLAGSPVIPPELARVRLPDRGDRSRRR